MYSLKGNESLTKHPVLCLTLKDVDKLHKMIIIRFD